MFPRVGNKILCFSFPFSGAEARDIGFRLFVHKIDKKDGDFLYDFGSAPPEGEKAGGSAGEEKRRAVGGAGPYKEYEGRSVLFTGAIHESPVYAVMGGRFVKRPYRHRATSVLPQEGMPRSLRISNRSLTGVRTGFGMTEKRTLFCHFEPVLKLVRNLVYSESSIHQRRV